MNPTGRLRRCAVRDADGKECDRSAVGVTTIFVRGRLIAKRVCEEHAEGLHAMVADARRAGFASGRAVSVRTIRRPLTAGLA